MLSIVNDMLDFVKLDAHQLLLECEPFHPVDLFSRTVALLNQAAAARLVKLRLFQPYGRKMTCQGDERRIGQLLANLLSNAIKFSKPHHYVELHVTHHSSRPILLPSSPRYSHYSPTTTPGPTIDTDDETFWLYIRVADAGCGIAQSRLPHVFDRFYEEELQSFAPRIDGVGLGLAVCRLLTELMKGQLMVESKEGEGSVFHVVLPLSYNILKNAETGITADERDALVLRRSAISTTLQQTPLQSPSKELSRRLTNFNHQTTFKPIGSSLLTKQLSMPLPSPSTSISASSEGKIEELAQLGRGLSLQSSVAASPAVLPGTGVTVLIVDDNTINLKVAARLLQNSKHTCICALSGQEALEVAQTQHVDVVLMDLQMPEMDGLECTRRLRQMELDGRLRRGNGSGFSGRRLPIIAVTASEGAGVRERCLAEGMDACVFKPFHKQAILAVMASMVGSVKG